MPSKTYDPELVDASVTAEDIERAHDATPADFPDVEFQDQLEDTEPRALGLVGIIPATIPQAMANAKRLRDDHTNVGIGMCLATVRGPIFNLPAVQPDANSAYFHGAPFHTFTDLTKVPRGMAIYWTNPRHGHIAVSLGGGLCSTTDYHEPGFEGVALISKLAAWCSGTFRGGAEELNGFDVWPDPKKPKPKPKPWDLQDRADFIHRQLIDARKAGHDKVAANLKAWHDRMVARLKEQAR